MRNKITFALLGLTCSAFLFISYKAFSGTAVTWNGTSYTVPSVGDENWFGDNGVDGLLISLVNNGFQKTGGNFTLTSEVNFGGTAGLTGLYFGTRSSNDSTTGVFRLSNAEGIGWRNAGNSADLLLTVDSSNNLSFNGTSIISSSGIVPVSSGGTGIAGSYAIGDLLYATPNSHTLTKLPVGTTGYVLKSNGTVPQYGQITNASVDSAAAITRSKLANGTASHVVINDGSGEMSSEATLATSRGGTNIASYTTGDLLYASNGTTLSKLGIGSAGNVLKVSGGLPAWDAAGATLAVSPAVGSTLTASSVYDLFLSNPSGTQTITLPAATGSGKVFKFKKIDSEVADIVTIQRAGADTITDAGSAGSSTTLNTQGEEIEIVDTASAAWHVVSRRIPSIWIAYTPTGSWSANVTYTGFWRRVGDSVEVRAKVATSGAPTSAGLTINLPTGITIDTAKLTGTSSQVLGVGEILNSSEYPVHAVYSSTSAVAVYYHVQASAAFGVVTEAAPATFGAGDHVVVEFKVPVSGWGG